MEQLGCTPLDGMASGEPSLRNARDDAAYHLVERACVLLAVVALISVAWRYMDLLGDSFWSVASGRWILEHHRLPTTDSFSFTSHRAWIVHMPLSQVIFAWVTTKFGILVLELFGTLVSCAALTLIWLPHACSPVARLVTWPFVLALIFIQADDLCVRGQIFGDLALATLLVLLFRLRCSRAAHPLWALVLGAFWINLHSSVFIVVCLPLVWAASLTTLPAHVRPVRAPYLWCAALGALGMLINPYHYRLVGDLLRLLGSPMIRRIDLFRPPDFTAPSTWLGISIMVLAALWAWRCRRDNAHIGTPEVLVVLVWLVASVTARRYVPLGCAYSIAVLGRLASNAWPSTTAIAWRWPGYVVLAGLALGMSAWGISMDKDPWRDVPRVEAFLVEELALPDRVANLYHWGGYLDYAWNGRRKVFVDGRNQLFEGGAFEAESRLGRLENWRAILDEYRINTVLWERGGALDFALAQSSEWTEIRRGRIAVLYVRRQRI